MQIIEVEALLRDIGIESDDVAQVGAGAWSTAFRFRWDGGRWVVRVGQHVEDFKSDRLASRYRSTDLPIPAVDRIGQFSSGWYCISEFAPGSPLEDCSAADWARVVPSLASALESMRRCRRGSVEPRWWETLLAVDDDHVGTRAEGWRERIVRSPAAVQVFADGVEAIAALDLGEIDATLTHGDLINRNVHVDAGRITGIFDWGCLRWGDHLYDLAWFYFWSPWHPELEVRLLRDELDRRWDSTGYVIANRLARERASLTHIGLDHLIYNATIESWTGLDDVVRRMQELELI